METGNKVLADFEEKQSWLMRNALKLILAAFSAGSFTSFVEKMKKDPQSLANTIGTLSKVMTIFFAELGKKYLTKEIETSIHEKVATLFA